MVNTLEQNKPEIKVRLKRGAWEVEITCPEDKVRQVIEDVLSGLDRSVPSEPISEEPVTKGVATCRGLIEGLWKEGWFASEKALGDVHTELSRKGYNYDRTAVSHCLTDLVRENILTRVGEMRSYRYIQKRPPPKTEN